MAIISLMQGAVAGGTTSYLRARAQQEASEKKVDTWVTAALQVNHALLLSAETVGSAGVSLGSFALVTQAAYVFTPIVFAVGLGAKRIAPISPERANQMGQVYRAAVVVNSVASLALGNPIFAGASLAMLAIDVILEGDAKILFHYLNKVSAAFAFVGYGMQTFLANGAMATLGKVSTIVAGAKFFIVDNHDPEGYSPPASYSETSLYAIRDPGMHDCCYHSHGARFGRDHFRRFPETPRLLEGAPRVSPPKLDLSNRGNWTPFTRGHGAWG